MVKLGKKPFVPDDRDIKAKAILSAAPPLHKPAAVFGYGRTYSDWLMLGNGPDDSVAPGFQGAGDCVFAGGGHETMLTNRLAGRTVHISGKESIADYSAVTGYVVGDDSTDNGTEVREALKYRKNVGLLDSIGKRHPIGAYASINPKDYDELIMATYYFTCVGMGFEFPASAMTQFDQGMMWDVIPNAKIEGGHYVPVLGRNSRSTATGVTWARRQVMSRAFYETYNDEAWAIVYPEELENGKTHRGLDLTALTEALAELK